MSSSLRTTPHKGSLLIEKYLVVAGKGDLAGVNKILQEDPALLNTMCQGHNRTLLWEACRRNRVEVVKFLLRLGADVNIPGRHRVESFVLIKPYAVASVFKRHQLCEMLSNAGTIMDVYTACFLGNQSRVEDLIRDNPKIVNEEQVDDSVWIVTALHHAVSGGHKELAEFLIAKGAEVKQHSELLLEMCRSREDILTCF